MAVLVCSSRCRPVVENHSPASRVDSLIRGNFAGNSGPSEWWMEWLWRWTLAATCSVRIPCRWLAGSRNLVGLPQRLPQETYLPLYVHVGRHHRHYNENMAMLWWSMVQSPHFPHQSQNAAQAQQKQRFNKRQSPPLNLEMLALICSQSTPPAAAHIHAGITASTDTRTKYSENWRNSEKIKFWYCR